MAVPSQDIYARAQFVTPLDATTRKAISGTAAQLGPMKAKCVYYLTVSVDAFFRQGATGMTAPTTSTGDPLWSKERVQIYCEDATADGYVDVITDGTAGFAYLTLVS